ncbi:hypothetical protein F5Y07DRAFT_394112 [Xylaria sp. FL0933]|nr:hypothetical protein F5Y07DRAFT_394112 [Xylaria sp. FL0933]
MAGHELQHTARHSAEKIAHKVSNRSLRSKCSHESSDDELMEAHEKDGRSASSPASPPASPPPTKLEDGYAQSERISTPSRGEAMSPSPSHRNNGLSVDRDDVRRSRSFNRTPLSHESVDSDTQPVRGQSSSPDNLAVPKEASRRGNTTRTSSNQGGHKVADNGVD